jgi:hypothetical protein
MEFLICASVNLIAVCSGVLLFGNLVDLKRSPGDRDRWLPIVLVSGH